LSKHFTFLGRKGKKGKILDTFPTRDKESWIYISTKKKKIQEAHRSGKISL
jgi:hypothetical protein